MRVSECVFCYAANSTGVSDIRSVLPFQVHTSCTHTHTHTIQRLHCSVRAGADKQCKRNAFEEQKTARTRSRVAPEGRLATRTAELSAGSSGCRCGWMIGRHIGTINYFIKIIVHTHNSGTAAAAAAVLLFAVLLSRECRIVFAHWNAICFCQWLLVLCVLWTGDNSGPGEQCNVYPCLDHHHHREVVACPTRTRGHITLIIISSAKSIKSSAAKRSEWIEYDRG